MTKAKFEEMRSKEIAKRDGFKAEADKLVSDETREFSPEDQEKVDDLVTKIDAINDKLDSLAKLVDEDGEAEEERAIRSAPAAIRSRGRVSAPGNIQEHAKREGFSLGRAVSDFLTRGSLTGIELECDQELRRNQSASGSFLMPFGDSRKLNERTDLTLSTGAGSIPTYWDAKDFVDYLYPVMVGPKLGFRYMSGLAGVTKLPRQSGVPTVSAVAEQGSGTASAPGLDNVTFTPHTITANVTVSRKFAQQSIIPAQEYVMSAGSRQIAVTMDNYALCASGSSNQPYGLLNNTAVTQIQAATSNVVAYADILAVERMVAESNANFGNLGYVTSPYGFAKLAATPKIGSTFPVFLISEDSQINGSPCLKSSQVPKNLTYSSTPNLTALIYGQWDMLAVATFGDGVDVVVDPYTKSTSGDVVITFLLDMDTNLLQPGAFAVIPNIA